MAGAVGSAMFLVTIVVISLLATLPSTREETSPPSSPARGQDLRLGGAAEASTGGGPSDSGGSFGPVPGGVVTRPGTGALPTSPPPFAGAGGPAATGPVLGAAAPPYVDSAQTGAAEVDPVGPHLDAHDGKIVQFDGTYYLYGTSYDCGFALNRVGTSWCGIRVYTSPDLTNWTDAGFAVPPDSWQAACAPPLLGCFRPHVVRSPVSGRYVLWMNSFDRPSGYHVLTAPTPLGPFTDEAAPALAVNENQVDPTYAHGDEDVIIDESGAGWIAYTTISPDNRHDIAVERLNSTLTSGTGQVVQLGLTMAEAPALFSRDGRWWLTYSDPACPYCGGTGTGLASAPSPLGPWTLQPRLSADSCGGQPAAVSELTAHGGIVWLYQSDLWQSGEPNQAHAGFHHEELQFDAGGNPLPLHCGH